MTTPAVSVDLVDVATYAPALRQGVRELRRRARDLRGVLCMADAEAVELAADELEELGRLLKYQAPKGEGDA